MFSEVQLAFFDYDRTLYAHAYPRTGDPEDTYYDECIRMLSDKSMKERFAGDKPIKSTKWLVNLLQENKVPVYTLTHEIFNLRDVWKSFTAQRDFGIKHYLTVDSPEHKIDMIRAVAKIHNVPLRYCLFVDDKMDIIHLACAVGIYGLHTSNVAQMYEEIFSEDENIH